MYRNRKFHRFTEPTDYGPEPFVINIDYTASINPYFRVALWTGNHLQVTLMSIEDEIGLEIHPDLDQFLQIEDGYGIVKMGKTKENLNYQSEVKRGMAIFIPAGTWHNLENSGSIPIKLYSVYAPPQHPHGTVHKTKADADAAENYH